MNNENGQEKKEPFVFEVNTKKTNQPYVFNASSGQGLIDEIDNSYQRSQPANPQPVNNVQVQNNQPVNPQPVNNVQVQNDQIAAQQQKLLQELYSEEETTPTKKSGSLNPYNGYGKIALILSLIPTAIEIFCLLLSRFSFEDALLLIWVFYAGIYMFIGIPIFIASIIFAILGLIKDIDKKTAIISFFMHAIPIITIIVCAMFA